MDRYDSIVIGAGHNGLICAAYLARSGRRVLVLEAAESPGGFAARREFYEGFRASVAHTVSHFSRTVADELKLAAKGLPSNFRVLPTVGLNTRQEHIVLQNSSLSGADIRDADAYARFHALLARFARALEPFWSKTMPRIGNNSIGEALTFAHIGFNLRRMGKRDLHEFFRIASLPARDLMEEYFESDTVKTAVSWDGLIGSKIAPRSPNSAVLTMLYRMSEQAGHAIPTTGVAGLVDALSASAKDLGAEIRCGQRVSRILVNGAQNGLSVNGVELASGEMFRADEVISAVDPRRTFLELVGAEYLDIGFTNRIRRLRCDGYVAKLHLALDGLPQFSGLESVDGRLVIAPDPDTVEYAFDDAKYGECPTNPLLEIVIPSIRDESLAPADKHVLSAHVMYIPYRLKGGWTDAARNAACERAIDTIERYAPGIRDQILHSEFLTPADLEQEYRVTGGHWHHTELAIDQMLMMRPTYDAAQYRAPLPNLFLCGAGCHPGGDISGAAGHNAAGEILR
ncbi:MAG: NAD(P)/FAD-dependent oxidoreductase [Woeseia sp.]